MSVEVIESYLVELGFVSDPKEVGKFKSTLAEAESAVVHTTERIFGNVLKFQAGVTTAFAAIGFGVVDYVDKLATADQQLRLFAMRNFMTLEQARGVQTALGALGVTLDDIVTDRTGELHERFTTLIQDQKQLQQMLGPQYEQQMRSIRDVRFELERLEVKGQYFGMMVVSNLLKQLGFGDGSLLEQLRRLNDWFMQNMPRWSEELSTDLVPILHDFWNIMKDLVGVAEEAGLEFTNLVGIFSGDSSIEGATFDFHKFAGAIEHVAHWLERMLHYLTVIEHYLIRFAPLIGGAAGGGSVGGTVGSVIGGILGIEGGPAGILAGAGLGGTIGTAAGGLLGGAGGAGVTWMEESARSRAGGAPGGASAGSTADQARALAAQVAAATGLPAELIFGQWAHETGGFTNRGARDLHNLAGIRIPGSTEYQSFDSLQAFAARYAQVVESRRYTSQGINGAMTPEAFAHALKMGGYYEASEAEYASGIKRWEGGYRGGSPSITVGSIPIHIGSADGMSHQQVAAAVKDGVSAGLAEHNERLMAELSGPYAR